MEHRSWGLKQVPAHLAKTDSILKASDPPTQCRIPVSISVNYLDAMQEGESYSLIYQGTGL